jgi:hypothetical protein
MDDKVIHEVFKKLRARLPARVADVRYVMDTDWTGDPRINIWVVMKDSMPEPEWSRERLQPIEERIVSALRKRKVTRWPYVFFRSQSEQAEIDADCARERALDRRWSKPSVTRRRRARPRSPD